MSSPTSTNLSIAWAELFLELMERGTKEISPAIVTVKDFQENGLAREVSGIRIALDRQLSASTGDKNRPLTTNNVASTIFPLSLWNRGKRDKGKHVFERYRAIYPRIKARDSRNRRGTYFHRLIDYAPLHEGGQPINQLSHIIDTYSAGTHRRSALQASTFDPRFDHNKAPMMGFPCLQQVAFVPTEEGLTVTGFYPVQYVFERGYGNYLGLCWLGLFVAEQLRMPLVAMNCFVNVAQLGNVNKTDMRALAREISGVLGR